jgi:hypothetical protein
MHGRLAAYDLVGGVNQSIYRPGTNQYSTVTVSFANRGNIGALVRIALTSSESTVDDTDYIVYDYFVEPNKSFQKNGIVIPAGQYLTVRSSVGRVSAVVYGYEIGTAVSFTPITLLSDTVAPIWNTASISSMVNGTPVSIQLQADSGDNSITFARQTGTLPTGLTLSSAGLLSGTPNGYTAPSTAISFTVRATDPAGNFADQAFSFNVTVPVAYVTGSGGTVATAGGYKTHSFTTVGAGTFTISNVS